MFHVMERPKRTDLPFTLYHVMSRTIIEILGWFHGVRKEYARSVLTNLLHDYVSWTTRDIARFMNLNDYPIRS
jgi:hypothetical protein